MSGKGDLQYIAVIDTSAYDGALDHMVASATDASSQIASESQKINDLLTNIPKVDIDFLQSIDNVEEMQMVLVRHLQILLASYAKTELLLLSLRKIR